MSALRYRLSSFASSLAVRVALGASRRARLPAPAMLRAARSVLVVKLDGLGDFVLATPFLRELRRAAPGSRITLVNSVAAAPLAKSCPHVDRSVALQLARHPRFWGSLRRIRDIDRFFRIALANDAFDLAVIPRSAPDLHQARLVASLSGAGRRVGFAASAPDCPSFGALTDSISYPATPVHEVDANLLILATLGASPISDALELHCGPDEVAALERRLAAVGIASVTPLFVLGVGASLPHKLWPAERFVALAQDFLVARSNLHVVVLGGDQDRVRFPANGDRFHNWAGQLTPNQSWALLRRARLFVGNDSGAVHLAAAAGCPTVVVHWDHPDSDPRDVNSHHRFTPWRVPYRLVHPGTIDGLRDASLVELQRVVSACKSLLAETQPAPGPDIPPSQSSR